MLYTHGSNLNELRKELDFVFKKAILPCQGLFISLAENQWVDNKKIKHLILELSRVIETLGLPVINLYSAPSEQATEFWMVGFVRDKAGADSSITITKIERKRPTLSVLLFTSRSVVYTIIGAELVCEFKFVESDILSRKYLNRGTGLEKSMDDYSALRIIQSEQSINQKTEKFLTNLINHRSGTVRFVRAAFPSNLLWVATNKGDIVAHLKPIWAWKIAAFDHLIHSCSYMVTEPDGIMPIEYTSDRRRISGFIAKNNFEFDSLNFNMD